MGKECLRGEAQACAGSWGDLEGGNRESVPMRCPH